MPKGERLKESSIKAKSFPAPRAINDLCPQQLDRTSRAAHGLQDGGGYRAEIVFDNSSPKRDSAAGGHLRQPRQGEGAQHEYAGPSIAASNTMGSRRYARFLSRSFSRLSKGSTTSSSRNPNDCAIGGASSRAICAFTAAWKGPMPSAAFSTARHLRRQRGNVTPRLSPGGAEAHPRISQDSENDLNIYGGDWWMVNRKWSAPSSGRATTSTTPGARAPTTATNRPRSSRMRPLALA